MSRPGRLIIIGGPPASGKSTLARKLADEQDAIRLSPDEWLTELGVDLRDSATRDRLERLQWQLAQELLGRALRVVLDWGVFTADKRAQLRHGARELGASVELHFLDEPREVLWQRILRRADDGEQPAPPREEFESMLDELEPPDARERASFDAPA